VSAQRQQQNSAGGALTASHLVHQRAQQGVGPLPAQEALRVVEEDLVEAVEDVLKQQTVLLHGPVRVKERLVCGDDVIAWLILN